MTIYCSKKLESFLGEVPALVQSNDESLFGDWNGDLFIIDRRKCVIFMNSKTCYSVAMTNVLKKDMKDLQYVFKERLIQQLSYELNLKESQEIKWRKELTNIALSKTNNNKKIIGTINHHIADLMYRNDGRVTQWDDVIITATLNDCLLGTMIEAGSKKRNRDYFKPIELMQELSK